MRRNPSDNDTYELDIHFNGAHRAELHGAMASEGFAPADRSEATHTAYRPGVVTVPFARLPRVLAGRPLLWRSLGFIR
jgi:hypothetical protein